MSRMPDDRNVGPGRVASESEDDRTEQDIDGPRDELEPGEVIEAESDASSVIRGRRQHA
jgi:hypothetical protein